MVQFTAVIKRFAKQGEKTGWTYIDVPSAVAEQLQPGNKKGFRVKGRLDDHPFQMIALLPMGGGDFIMTLNAAIRKGIKKQKGATVQVKMETDAGEIKPPAALMECLRDEPAALAYFEGLNKGHQHYFINWINSAKTDATKAKRIGATIQALEKHWDYGQMIRSLRKEKTEQVTRLRRP
jgi:hypothetical protein